MEHVAIEEKIDISALSAITLRAAESVDRDFLLNVYADSRREELVQIQDWSEKQKKIFLESQFNAQDEYYREHYKDCEFNIICHLGLDVGRLYIDRQADHICIMDIAVLHGHRRRGIARFLIQQILAEAKQFNRAVNLHVEPDNPAKQLYLSEGFTVTGEISFYQKMEWQPA